VQFGYQNPPPKIPTEEDALCFIVRALRDTKVALRDYGYDVSLLHIFDLYLNTVCAFQNSSSQQRAYKEIAPPFYAAAWELCRRGVLRPGIHTYGVQEAGAFVDGYSITPAGARWIKDAGQYDALPIEPGRFSELLDSFTSRFGAGFQERSQEAIRCYGTNAYLGCCAMCGAAAESILLAVAIAKDGDQDKIEKMYSASGGRDQVEKLILGSQPENVQNECCVYFGLLKYWGDLTPHGKASGVTETEAYTALMLLLRLAQFANDRWDELTKRCD
jgi:hypothetical protein